MIRSIAALVAVPFAICVHTASGGEPVEPLSSKSVILPDEFEQAGGWEGDLALTLWAVNLEGVMGVGGFVAPVDVSFGDVLDSLNFALAGTLQRARVLSEHLRHPLDEQCDQ